MIVAPADRPFNGATKWLLFGLAARAQRVGSMARAWRIQFGRLIFIIARELAKRPYLVGPAVLRRGRPAFLCLLAEII